MRDDFSLARPAGHLRMGDGSGPDGLAEKDGAKSLSGAESGDTATTPLDKPSRTKNLITELPQEVLQQIIAKTDGVPLFIEEMTKAVLESGQLTAVDGHYEFTGSFATFAIP